MDESELKINRELTAVPADRTPRICRAIAAEIIVPPIIADAGEQAARRFLEFFAAAIRMLFDWLVTGQIVATNSAQSIRDPETCHEDRQDAVLAAEQARKLLDSIDPWTLVGRRDWARIESVRSAEAHRLCRGDAGDGQIRPLRVRHIQKTPLLQRQHLAHEAIACQRQASHNDQHDLHM